MSVAINNRFGILLAEKRAQEKRNISIAEVADKTGIAGKTLRAWANNTVTRFDMPVIDALCRYFGVQPGELFEYIDDMRPS
jgi:putative transcriptional regulator